MINWRLRLTLSLNALDKLDMAAHACDRVLRVGCIIAYLDNYPSVLSRHLAEAIGYRSLDRASYGSLF